MTKIVIGFPPNIQKIWEAFPFIIKNPTVIFTYGDTIYNPGGYLIDQDLLAHEETHISQQQGIPDEWWDLYIKNTSFRLIQEAEAYKIQYLSYCSHQKDRNQRYKFLYSLARDLSSPIYGSCISTRDALTLIENYKGKSL